MPASDEGIFGPSKAGEVEESTRKFLPPGLFLSPRSSLPAPCISLAPGPLRSNGPVCGASRAERQLELRSRPGGAAEAPSAGPDPGPLLSADIVQAHYQAVGFLPLAHSVGQGLFEELLLLLQPLSLLPFDLDLLFEHHLLQMGKEQQQQKELLRVKQDLVLSAHSTLQLMRTRTKDSGSWGAEWDPGQEDGQPAAAEERLRGERRKAGQKDKQASWWYQLMQSSQVYIEGSSKGPYFTRCEQKKTPAAARQSEPRQGPPPREGVVEGAEACPITEVACPGRRVQAETGAESKEKQDPLARAEGPEKTGRPFWMGSPPDSVVTELKRSKEKEGLGQGPKQEKSSCHAPSSSQPKWGHLFGSRKAPKEPKPTNR